MSARFAVLALVAALVALPVVAAESLFAASVRNSLAGGGAPAAGSLYRVDLETGKYKGVAALRVAGEAPIGITGLAEDPRSRKLYGITSSYSPNHPSALVEIEVATGESKVIGTLGVPASDITFGKDGTLFAWLRETGQLATIDLETGRVRPRGAPGSAGEPGGLAIDRTGRMYIAGSGATGTLDTADPATGAITRGVELKGAPYPAGINSLTFSSSGVLYDVNTNLGSPATTMLVTIDPASGEVTPVSQLPPDTDALLFAEDGTSVMGFAASRGGLSLIAALACIVIALGVVFATRRPKSA
jgi:hypothetical protein